MRTNIVPKSVAAACSLAVVSLCGGACVTPQPQPSLSTFAAPSSSSFETSYAMRPSQPGLVVVEADLVVRPDQVCVPLAIKARGKDAKDALARARAAVDDARAKAGVDVRVDDIRAVHDDRGAVVVVNAAAVAALGEGDAFSRAAVVAALDGALWPLAHPEKPSSDVFVDVGAAEPGVKDTEQHRQKMLEGWASRIAAMSRAVAGDDVELQNCQAPPAVQVRGGTFEKVGLSLPISCTIAVKARG